MEEKPSQVNTAVIQPKEPWNLLLRYSSLTRLLRVTAWCLRAASILKRNYSSSNTLPLSVSELENAKFFWIRYVQEISYRDEIKIIIRGQSLPRSNPLVRLTPYIDSSNLL